VFFLLVCSYYDTSPGVVPTCGGIGREGFDGLIPGRFDNNQSSDRCGACFLIPFKPPRVPNVSNETLRKASSSQARDVFVDLNYHGSVESDFFLACVSPFVVLILEMRGWGKVFGNGKQAKK